MEDYKYHYDIKDFFKILASKDSIDTNDSKQLNDSDLCRICYDESLKEPLICPCKCSGSIKWVHESCLKKWIDLSNKTQCPQCKYQYKKICKYRYELLKYFDNNITIKITTALFCILFIILFTIISIRYTEINTDMSMFDYLNNIYKGIKIFSLLSIISLYMIHVGNLINIVNIIDELNLEVGNNIIELSLSIFKVYCKITKILINKILDKREKFVNFI